MSVCSRRRVWVRLAIVALVTVFSWSGTLALAQSYDPDQDIPKPTSLQKRMNKLGRGFSNVLFGWTEIPVTWYERMKQGKPLTYLLSTAPVLGTTRAFMRTGVGVYEVFTFYIKNPSGDYEAILEPEYLF